MRNRKVNERRIEACANYAKPTSENNVKQEKKTKKH